MSTSELVVLSHLRWTWVWQRPQHLISRLARQQRTWFVEEPAPCEVPEPRLRTQQHGPLTRVWLEVPRDPAPVLGGEGHLYFDAPQAADYAERLSALFGPAEDRCLWLYTPSALHIAIALDPQLMVYDVMDDLASFAEAPPQLRLNQRQALRIADVVFAGGRSLHRMALQSRPDVHLFPSGVETEHFALPRAAPSSRARPVAGYVGVIDERIDLHLVADLARALPDWEVCMVGPLAKIESHDLPGAPNLVYPGPVPYEQLPQVMAGFDVALMPFALNEATRSISPTKTLEYLAAGLPVVSTRVPDVVADYSDVVYLREDGQGFAEACRRARLQGRGERDRQVRTLLAWHSWDGIAARMTELIAAAWSNRADLEEATG
jgi:glycosyltransferase involved in cell wall biosynthesis